MIHSALTDELRETAALYALGILPDEEARHFDAHLTGGCVVCETELRECASVARDLALVALPVPPAPDLRARVLAAARATAHPFAFVLADEGTWIELVPGVTQKQLGAPTRTTRSYLVKVQPGARIPSHPHTAIEHCLVLAGDLQAAGRSLGPGDYHRAGAGSRHGEIWSNTGCTFLIVEAAE